VICFILRYVILHNTSIQCCNEDVSGYGTFPVWRRKKPNLTTNLEYHNFRSIWCN